jgi:hypothetical protein
MENQKGDGLPEVVSAHTIKFSIVFGNDSTPQQIGGFVMFQVNCCVLRDLTPLEEFVFSERANHTVHQGNIKLTIYDQFRMLDTLRLHR